MLSPGRHEGIELHGYLIQFGKQSEYLAVTFLQGAMQVTHCSIQISCEERDNHVLIETMWKVSLRLYYSCKNSQSLNRIALCFEWLTAFDRG